MGVLLVALGMMIGGCATSAPTKFYVLNGAVGAGSPGGECVSLGIGPVDIPGYLDRPQIVTRPSPYEVHPSEFEQWGEPLAQGFARVLGDNLARQLCVRSMDYYPFRPSAAVDYQVSVQVKRFEGQLGGNAELIAHWTVFREDGKKVIKEKVSGFTEPVAESGYEGLVAAQSKVLQKLGVEIAAEIKAISK
jgi:hypothetical protein